MIVAAIAIGFTTAHTIGLMTLILNADRLGGAVAGSAIVDSAKTALYRKIAESPGGTVTIGLAKVPDLGCASDSNAQRQKECGDPGERTKRRVEELRCCQLLLHEVSVSTVEENQNCWGFRRAERPRQNALIGLYRRLGVMTR